MVSDEILMVEFQAGSREAFDELFARYQQLLYSFYSRRLARKEQAEDLAQDTWIAVLRGAERYQPRAPFRMYLFGIAFKLLAGERRRSSRQSTTLTAPPVLVPELSEHEHWVREALDRLDEMEREILMLREYEQLSYAEIAGLLHIPLNTVRSRLFRARLTLKHLLRPDSESITGEGWA